MQYNGKIYKLLGVIQHYDWGGYDFIPSLLNKPNPDRKPFAEYWMGAHDNASSIIYIDNNDTVKLNSFIKKNPIEILGGKAFKKFGRLPYLLKVLDVKDMLSIQVHPTKKNAEKEFHEENKKGIAHDARHRNYKDDNHKPELMVALGEFWLLHGFKPADQLVKILENVSELNFLVPLFRKSGYQELYKHVMEMEQFKVNSILQPLLDRIIPMYEKGQLDKNDENFWTARGAKTFSEKNKIDRGIFSIYFLNLVHLVEGNAIFQDAGILHAYLEGQNIEIMANSDNVLRGGLTNKHIDVAELMKHVTFKQVEPRVLSGISVNVTGEIFYKTPVSDFQLNKLDLKRNKKTLIESETAEIFFVYQGSLVIYSQNKNLDLNKGEAMLAVSGASLTFEAKENAIVFRATVPEASE